MKINEIRKFQTLLSKKILSSEVKIRFLKISPFLLNIH